MIQSRLPRHQAGVALILSLLLLFVLTLVAVSSYTSSHVQERAASNARLQTMAFEAAAAGANNAIDFFLTNVEADAPDTLCGRRDHLGWDDPTPWREVTYDVDGVRLEQRMYCLNDEYPCGPTEVGCVADARPPRSQLFVASRGLVEANGNVVASREVEVRIDRRNDTYEVEGCGAICFAACEVDYYTRGHTDLPSIEFPASNAFTVYGGDGPAVTAGKDCEADPDLYDIIMDDVADSRYGNYDGGIHRSDPGEPWNDPDDTEAFRLETVEIATNGVNPTTGEPMGYYIDSDFVAPPGIDGEYFPDITLEGGGIYIDNGNTEYGSPGNEKVVYIQGDVSFGGGISGAGIMMVEGDIYWNGTPDYQGLIVSLGGSYTIDGGGLGGNHAGSVVVLNHDSGCTIGSCADFGAVSWMNEGGGTAEYNWDCDALIAAFAMIPDLTVGDDDLWGLDCDRAPPTLFETPGELVIASWRENIGWREEYFAAE